MGIRGRNTKPKPEPVTVTKRTLEEIEVALAEKREFHFVRNLVAFNVRGESRKLPIYHECDMLVCSASGYLTEIEIKRSWADFLADFKKRHEHESPYGSLSGIKYFYYCLPSGCLEKAYDVLDEHGTVYSGIITYDEDLTLEMHGRRVKFVRDGQEQVNYCFYSRSAEPLFLEQRLELARLGCMRVVTYKRNTFKDKKARKPDKRDNPDVSLYRMYLKTILQAFGSPLKDDEDSIADRADEAEAEFEECRLHGLTVLQAQESAMLVLLSGLNGARAGI